MGVPTDDSAFANADMAAYVAWPGYATTFDVTSYGAVGDGTTDDSVAVNAAIDAAISFGGHCFIYFPTGTYAVRTLSGTHTDLYEALFNLTNDGARSMNNLCFIGDHDTDGTPLSTIKGYMPSLADPATDWQESPFGLSRFIMFYQSPQDGLSPQNVQFRSLVIDGNAGYTGDFTVEGSYKYATVTKVAGGTGYQAGDVLTPVIDTNNPQVVGFETEQAQITVNTVSGGVITAVTLSDPGRYKSINTGHTFAVTGGHGSGFTFTCTKAFTGDGWDVTHKAFMIWRASNVLIYNCDIKNWRGEVIYGGSNQAVSVINTTVRGSNASAISIGAALLISDCTIGGTTTDLVFNGTENFSFDSSQSVTVKRTTTKSASGGNGFVHLGVASTFMLMDDCDLYGRFLISETAHNVTVQNSRFHQCGIVTSNLGLYPESSQGFHAFTISGNTHYGKSDGFTTQLLTLQNGVSDGLIISGNTVVRDNSPTYLVNGGIFQTNAFFQGNVLTNGAIDIASDLDFSEVALWTGTVQPSGIGSIGYQVDSEGNGDTITIFPITDYTALTSGNGNTHNVQIDDTKLDRYPASFETIFRQSGTFVLKKNSAWNAFANDVPVTDELKIRLNNSRLFEVITTPPTMGNPLASAVMFLDLDVDALDDSGNGLNFTNNGTVTFSSSKANFVSASSQSLSHASTAALTTGAIDYTIGLWADVHKASGAYSIFTKDSDSAGREFTVDVHDGNLRFYINGGGDIHTEVSTPDPGGEYLLLCWYDATAAKLNLQINNGSIVQSGTVFSSPTATANVRIGARDYVANEDYATGTVRCAFLIKSLLSTDDKTTLYNGGTPMKWADLVALGAPTAGTLSNLSVTATTASFVYGTVSGGTPPYSNQLKHSLTSGSGYSNVGSPQVGATASFSDSGLAPGTDYYYIVVTTDNASQTATSNEVHVTTSAAASTLLHAYMPPGSSGLFGTNLEAWPYGAP